MLIRESLESLITPMLAQQALFDAMESAAADPHGDDTDLRVFVQGDLRAALERRTSSRVADDAVDHIVALLTQALGPAPALTTPPFATPKAAAANAEGARRDSFPTPTVGATLEVRPILGPVRALVVARHRRLADSLRSALGPGRVAVAFSDDQARAALLLAQLDPTLVLVDGSDPPDIAFPALAEVFVHGGERTQYVLWGSEDANARGLLEALQAQQPGFTPLERREGVDPLFDMIRARGAQG